MDREGERKRASIKIRFATPEALEKEYVNNINKGGLFVNTRKPHPIRSHVKFTMVLPVTEEVIELTGEVVHCMELLPGMDPSKAGIAVQFIDLTQKKRRLIEDYIARIGKQEEEEIGKSETAPEGETPGIDVEVQEILKDAIRRAAREIQEFSPELELEIKKKVKIFYAKRATKNHYDLLGVRHTATPDAIREAYHKLSMDFHPDRHHKRLPQELRPQIEEIFGKINRAYKTLRDIETRIDYDISLGNWGTVPDVPELSEEAKRAYYTRKIYLKKFPEKVHRAAEILGEAEAALHEKRQKEAIVKLKLAFSFDPFNERVIRHLEELGVKFNLPTELK